jgi:hypothetical protein
VNPIKQTVRQRPVPPEESRTWAEKEVNPLLQQLQRFTNLQLSAPSFARYAVINGLWQVTEMGTGGDALTDAAVLTGLADGSIRHLPPLTLTAPRTVTLSGFGASLARTWELWKLDTSGFDYTVTAGADVVVLPGATQWYLECRYTGAAWEALRLQPLTFSG